MRSAQLDQALKRNELSPMYWVFWYVLTHSLTSLDVNCRLESPALKDGRLTVLKPRELHSRGFFVSKVLRIAIFLVFSGVFDGFGLTQALRRHCLPVAVEMQPSGVVVLA